jgi:predicted AlkP superfamily phosphohydrolase/phosphomutase
MTGDTNRRKLFVVGIDGEGFLPNLREIADRGVHGLLRSSIPPVTGPAWMSFKTGKNPGKHGVYAFLVTKPGTYEEAPVNAAFCREKDFWEILTEHGRRVAILNLPMTYPPKPVNGVMISGFLTPSQNRDFVYPPELLDELEREFGPYYLYARTLDFTAPVSRRAIDDLVRDCREMAIYKFRVAHYLIERHDFDFVCTHIWGTDRIQHWLWNLIDASQPAYDNELGPLLADKIVGYYRFIDEQIGSTLRRMGEDTAVMVISDHGFGPIRKSIDLNVWLLREGYLALKQNFSSKMRYRVWKWGLTYEWLISAVAKPLLKMGLRPKLKAPLDTLTQLSQRRKLLLSLGDVDWSRTRAYCKSGMGQIMVNMRGREPQGSVHPGEEYQSLVKEIVGKLESLQDPETGRRVGGQRFIKEEIYRGPRRDHIPDIVYLPQEDGYQAGSMGGFGTNKLMVEMPGIRSDHCLHGIFLARGEGIKEGADLTGAELLDLAPTILYYMGCPIPRDMDGKVLEGALTRDFLANNPVRFEELREEATTESKMVAEEDQEEVLKKLKDLGYIS